MIGGILGYATFAAAALAAWHPADTDESRLYDTSDRTRLANVSLSPDGRTVLFCDGGGGPRILDLRTGLSSPLPWRCEEGFRFTGDGKSLVLYSSDAVAIRPLAGGGATFAVRRPMTPKPSQLPIPRFDRDGNIVPLVPLAYPATGPGWGCAALDPDRDAIYVANADSEVERWSLKTNLVTDVYTAAAGRPVYSLVLSPNGSRFVLHVGPAHEKIVVDVKTGKVLSRFKVSEYGSGGPFLADGKTMFVSGGRFGPKGGPEDAKTKWYTLVDTDTGAYRELGQVHGWSRTAALSPDGREAFTTRFGIDDVEVVDTATGKVVRKVRMPIEPKWMEMMPGGKAYLLCDQSRKLAIVPAAVLLGER